MQSKITHHSKKQNNHYLNNKRQSVDANTDIIQLLELFGKDLKAVIINLFHEQL